MPGKTLSVRLDSEQLEQLQTLALVDKTSLGEEVRQAVTDYATRRVNEPGFEAKANGELDRYRQVIESLKK